MNVWVAALWASAAVRAVAPVEPACDISSVEYALMRQSIADGDVTLPLEKARSILERDPSCPTANLLQAEALVALGQPDDALGLLTDWANQDPSDAARVEGLIDFHRRVGDWRASEALADRIDVLVVSRRPALFRDLLDDLYDAGELNSAARVLDRLLPEATRVELTPLRRMLEAVTEGDMRAMWDELTGLPSADQPAHRKEALVLLARRVAARLTEKCNAYTPDGLAPPPTLPQISTKVEPSYPDRMRRERVTGTMIFMAVVLPTGEPVLLGGQSAADPALRRAGAEAVAQWRYEPGRVDGTAVMTPYTVRVDFRLQ